MSESIITTISLLNEITAIQRRIALREEIAFDLDGKYPPAEVDKTLLELENLYMEKIDFIRKHRQTVIDTKNELLRNMLNAKK